MSKEQRAYLSCD